MVASAALLAALAAPVAAAAQAPGDVGKAAARAKALVARMTLEEKISQVHGTGFITGNGYTGHTPAITRLGIPDFTLADGPNGVGNGARGVTAFPAAINNAATWDTALIGRYGRTLATEHAGKGNDVALAPTINILRVPGWGRAFETFSEDPFLTGEVAKAEIRGIQSRGVLAEAKHYAANNQETQRDVVDVRVSERALHEIYLAAFEKAIKEGGALTVMCAYNKVAGSYACENRELLTTVLKDDWGFAGPVVSDWFATHSTAPAANAGLDLEMPAGNGPLFPGGTNLLEHFGADLTAAVRSGAVPERRIDDMATRILTARIAAGELDRGERGDRAAVVTSAAHRTLAERLAADGTVLLRNTGVLPLRRDVKSIAVVGAAAQSAPIYTGGGSANVVPSQPVTPLQGIQARAGSRATVTAAAGTTGLAALPVIDTGTLTPLSGTGNGLTAEYFTSANFSGTPVIARVDPTVDLGGNPAGLSGKWSARWRGTFTARTAGLHRFSLRGSGTMELFVNGRRVLRHLSQFGGGVGHAVVQLAAGQKVPIRVDFVADTGFGLQGAVHLGWQAPNPTLVGEAVRAARAADVAVVFVSDLRTEGADLETLALPADQDELVEAVAAANKQTVVVLNTGGPTLTPWAGKVAGLVEAWYPGEVNGAAIASILFGDVNPSGRLPATFPRTDGQGPLTSEQRFPGTNQRVRYSEDLLVGYRYYDARGRRPRYPFGFGLSYTTFEYGRATARVAGRGAATRLEVRVPVENTGAVDGAEVVQAYVAFPRGAGEPPRQLKAFRKVTLDAGERRTVRLELGRDDLQRWDAARDRWATAAGTYRLYVGRSSRDLDPVATLAWHGTRLQVAATGS